MVVSQGMALGVGPGMGVPPLSTPCGWGGGGRGVRCIEDFAVVSLFPATVVARGGLWSAMGSRAGGGYALYSDARVTMLASSVPLHTDTPVGPRSPRGCEEVPLVSRLGRAERVR